MYFFMHDKWTKQELDHQLAEENSPHVHPEFMAVQKLPSVGIPSIDFSHAKQITEFVRKNSKYKADCALQKN
jgi:hypothetical protein